MDPKATSDERPLFKGHERAEFPSKRAEFPSKRAEFPSEFPAASAADNERPLERHEPSMAAIYRTATRAESPAERPLCTR